MRITFLAALLCVAGSTFADIPRLANGKPDLGGTYDVSTLTPLQRPTEFGDNLSLTTEQATAILRANRERIATRDKSPHKCTPQINTNFDTPDFVGNHSSK